MINHRKIAGALLAATAIGFASPAAAQRVDRIVAFGDSYADDGNFFQLVGINVLSVRAGRIAWIASFLDPDVHRHFGLPTEMPPGDPPRSDEFRRRRVSHRSIAVTQPSDPEREGK